LLYFIFFLGAEAESDKSKLEEEEAKKIVESLTDSITSGEKKDIEESTKDIVKKAALAVSSLKETEFDIRFNPDVFRFVPNFSFQNDNIFDIGMKRQNF
jgi:hypothetical protein